MFVKGFREQFDVWSGWHFLGPYFLCDFIGLVWAAVCVVIWEILDIGWHLIWRKVKYQEWYWYWKLLDDVFDHRGASWGDMVIGFVAVGVWCLKHGIL